LDHKPFDRDQLHRYAGALQGKGPVCEIGCGPGEIGRYLRDNGLTAVYGLDLSLGMLQQACRLNPDIDFVQANMLRLPLPDESHAGIVAFYSIIHLARTEAVAALREFRRVLKMEGDLLLSFHAGDEEVYLDEWYDQPVSLDATFFTAAEMRGYLAQAGFTIRSLHERESYPNEYPSQRVYIWARKQPSS
jgi:ubiquinone/menaquinone biosynthesis C-methylase UbiE